VIRPMTLSDLHQVTEIETSLFSHAWSQHDFETETTQNPFASYWVLEKDQNIIAYIGLWLMGTQAQVTTLGVIKGEQKQGYALTLLNHAFNLCENVGIPILSLEVRVSNQAAIHLYQKCDFRIEAIRSNYYTNPDEDAYLMIKEMKGEFK